MRTACPSCPFRKGSPLGYDDDAIEALDDGHIPSCHAVVGKDCVFQNDMPSEEHRCAGHDAWDEGRPGFCRPRPIN
jgi:hypothetical protein